MNTSDGGKDWKQLPHECTTDPSSSWQMLLKCIQWASPCTATLCAGSPDQCVSYMVEASNTSLGKWACIAKEVGKKSCISFVTETWGWIIMGIGGKITDARVGIKCMFCRKLFSQLVKAWQLKSKQPTGKPRHLWISKLLLLFFLWFQFFQQFCFEVFLSKSLISGP